MDQYQCKRCEQSIALTNKEEHDDWHFATDLADEDGTRNSTHAQSSADVFPMDSAQKDMSHKAAQNRYSPPAYLPPSSQTKQPMPSKSTNARSIRHYVNVVDRAAELRARDEVRTLKNYTLATMRSDG